MVYVHRKNPNATIICGIKFLPGMNTVSDAEFDMLKKAKNKAFDTECQCGNMVVGGSVQSVSSDAGSGKEDIKKRAANLAKEIGSVSTARAKEIIGKMGDGYILRALKETDGRKGVQEALDKRLEEIANQAGSDIAKESKSAPEGDGSDFLEKIGSGPEAQSGEISHTAIPALKKKKRKR